jgi:hypothetical protein
MRWNMEKEILRAKSGYLYLKIIHNGKTEIIFETQQDLIDEIIDILEYQLFPVTINDLVNCITESNFHKIKEARENVEYNEQMDEAYNDDFINIEPRWDGQGL